MHMRMIIGYPRLHRMRTVAPRHCLELPSSVAETHIGSRHKLQFPLTNALFHPFIRVCKPSVGMPGR
jgi:hypothetical protein